MTAWTSSMPGKALIEGAIVDPVFVQGSSGSPSPCPTAPC